MTCLMHDTHHLSLFDQLAMPNQEINKGGGGGGGAKGRFLSRNKFLGDEVAASPIHYLLKQPHPWGATSSRKDEKRKN